MSKPTVLVTNDDGIDSYFLHILVDELKELYTVYVAAPSSQKSWIGRAYSRFNDVTVVSTQVRGCTGWSIDGTPADCVNIALGHLLPEKPSLVLSGINFGYNTCLPIILSSGTVAGAIEGAFARIPAAAFSHQLMTEDLTKANELGFASSDDMESSIRNAARHATIFTKSIIDTPNENAVVHNINYPKVTTPETQMQRASLHYPHLKTVFKEISPGAYRFTFPAHSINPNTQGTDYNAIYKGNISHTVLELSELGRPLVAPASL